MTAIAIFGFATITSAQVPSYVPTTGLVGYWPFNGNANDESGNGNNGTVNGAILTSDRFSILNSAYFFDGSITSNISVPHSNQFDFSINNIQSISLWVKVNSLPAVGAEYYILKKQTGSGTNQIGFNVTYNQSLFAYRCRNGSTDNMGGVNSGNGFSVNNWYHIAIVWDNGVGKFYVNGALTNSITISSNIGLSTSSLFIGGESLDLMNGSIDDIGIWNRVLTACEVQDLYNSQLGSLNTSATQTQTALDSYTWPINGQTYTQSGNYTAIIPNVAGCDSTITLDLSLDFTGINEFSEDNLFTVFPNPTQSAINIKADNKLIGEVYSIYDNTGRVALTGKLNSKDTTIELNNLSGGIYMFSVGENMKQTFKVIKE